MQGKLQQINKKTDNATVFVHHFPLQRSFETFSAPTNM
jgi:hypothetical protein